MLLFTSLTISIKNRTIFYRCRCCNRWIIKKGWTKGKRGKTKTNDDNWNICCFFFYFHCFGDCNNSEKKKFKLKPKHQHFFTSTSYDTTTGPEGWPCMLRCLPVAWMVRLQFLVPEHHHSIRSTKKYVPDHSGYWQITAFQNVCSTMDINLAQRSMAGFFETQDSSCSNIHLQKLCGFVFSKLG